MVRRGARLRARAALAFLALLAGASGTHAGSGLLDPAGLWQAWPEARFVRTPAACLRPADLEERLRALAARYPASLRLEEAGRSVMGRPIRLLTLGSGPRRVLLWSQMHGDEPSATPALLDAADYLLGNARDADVGRLLEKATLLMIPMLNPDGAERYERRNAQGVDINRDARNLATPEGRALKAVRDRFSPELGFNLHDQGRRTLAGEGGRLATISLLAVAGDPQGTLTPGRARTRRVCSMLAQTLAAFVPGGVARYDEDWSPRAFGDNLTAWGTPVVLIESGGLPAGREPLDLTRLNFVALLSVLNEWARDDLSARDAAAYEALPRNASDGYDDVVVRGGSLLRPGVAEPYRADLAFDILDDDQQEAGCREARPGGSRVEEIGDARFVVAGRAVEASGRLLSAGFVASAAGLAAADWLTAEQLRRLASLGVVAVRWHVDPADKPSAERVLAALSVAGTGAALRLAPMDEPPTGLALTGPVSPAGSQRLTDVLAALGVAPRAPLLGKSLSEWLDPLTRPPGVAQRPGLFVGDPATFLIWDPGPESAAGKASLEAVYIDGREIRLRP